jgi:hypothetical protein
VSVPRRERDPKRIPSLGIGEPISHVREVKPGLMRKAKNEREERRVKNIASGWTASSAAAWAESQMLPSEKGPTVRIDSRGK